MRWLLILLAIVVVLALALAWGASWLLPDAVPVAWPAWATLLVVLAVVLFIVVRLGVRWGRGAQAAKRARGLDPKEVAEGGRRASRADLEREVEATVLALRKGRRARADRVPCYLVLGASGAGKSSLLERAGLPVLARAEGNRAPGAFAAKGAATVSGWSSRDALFLEVPGRFVTDEGREGPAATEDEWCALLDGVRLARPTAPVQGVIVVVSLPSLLAGTAYDRTQAASLLRARLEQVKERLEVVAPVYVVLSKADTVAGFTDFWGDLGAEQRKQAWGAAFPIDDPRLEDEADPARAARDEMQGLVAGVHTRLLDRLPPERSPARRARLLRFPVEVRNLVSPVSQFMGQLGQASDVRKGERPRLRGFYFVGTPDEAAPLAPAGRGRAPSAPPAAEAPSYFVKDVFAEVVFPDRGLVSNASSQKDRRQRREVTITVATLLASGAVLVPAMVSYFRNVQVARDVDGNAALLAAPPPGSVAGLKGDPVEPMLDALLQLDDSRGGFRVPGWFGPRASRELAPSLEQAYLARLGLDAIVSKRLNADFAELARARALDDPGATRAYESVKLYVMLATPKARLAEPAAEAWAAKHLAALWQTSLGGRDTVGVERLTAHATRYVKSVVLRPDPPLKADAKELARARAKLVDLRVRDLPYHWLVGHATGQPDVDISQVFEGSIAFLQPPPDHADWPRDHRVRGPFTAAGFPPIRDTLEASAPWPDEVVLERWVVGDVSIPENEEGLRSALRQRYYEDYRKEWKGFLRAIQPKTPRELKSARKEIGALSDIDGPYPRLFETIKSNAIHPQLTAKEQLMDHVKRAAFSCQSPLAAPLPKPPPPPPSPVEDFFRPFVQFGFGDEAVAPPAPGSEGAAPTVAMPSTRLGRYLKTLREVDGDLDTLAQAGGSATAGTEFPARMAEAKKATRAIFDEVNEVEVRDVLVQMLGLSIEASTDIGKHEATRGVSKDWHTAVYAVWQDRLLPRYPFKKGTTDSITMEEFASFFRPESGVLWAFVSHNLADRVERSNDRYALKDGPEPLRPEILPCLAVAQEITDAFFEGGPNPAAKLSVEVDWSQADVSSAKFWLQDKATALTKGEWSPTLTWGGETVKLEWAQAGRPAMFEVGRGSFSLFDLLERSDDLVAAGSGAARRHYVAQFPPVTLKVRSDEKIDMLRPDFFTRLHCPPEIVSGN